MAGVRLEYDPWGYRDGLPVYMVYLFITDSHDASSLKDVKRLLNDPTGKRGIYLIENKSPAVGRLGWEKLDVGLWYKIYR